MDLDPLVLRITAYAERLRTRSISAKNRAQRARLKSCGDDVRLNGPVKITGHDHIVIERNVHIGGGAIIGMGTVVAGTVPLMAIIGSEKWRVLGWRDQEHYHSLDERGAYGAINGHAYASSAPGDGSST